MILNRDDKQMRMTNQREILLRELRTSREHLTADELYERVKKRMPRISLATVYRNLEILSEAGIIGKMEVSGRQKRFEYDAKPHDHIHCVQCRRVDNIEFDRDLVEHASVGSPGGYRITGYHVEFTGICASCRSKEPRLLEQEMSELTPEQKQILEALASADKPYGNKDLVEATGLDRKVISSKVAAMKKAGLVDSPARCKYGVTGAGKKAIS